MLALPLWHFNFNGQEKQQLCDRDGEGGHCHGGNQGWGAMEKDRAAHTIRDGLSQSDAMSGRRTTPLLSADEQVDHRAGSRILRGLR